MPSRLASEAHARERADETLPAVRLDGVSVRYVLPISPSGSIKQTAVDFLRGRRAFERRIHEALRGIDLEIRSGECFGVVGPNGSGKTTLLRVVSGLQRPAAGRVRTRGRVAVVLHLAPGFHPELTGRENVFVNGAMLGYSRDELRRSFDDIVAFAGLGDFLSAPLRTYSAGMSLRLAFAVATCARPDILVLDEVLSVGDAAFQRKCTERLATFAQSGTTILFASHDVNAVRTLCGRAAWLEHGELRAVGRSEEVVAAYAASSARDA